MHGVHTLITLKDELKARPWLVRTFMTSPSPVNRRNRNQMRHSNFSLFTDSNALFTVTFLHLASLSEMRHP